MSTNKKEFELFDVVLWFCNHISISILLFWIILTPFLPFDGKWLWVCVIGFLVACDLGAEPLLTGIVALATFLFPYVLGIAKPSLYGLRLLRNFGLKRSLLFGSRGAVFGTSWHLDEWTICLIIEGICLLYLAYRWRAKLLDKPMGFVKKLIAKVRRTEMATETA